MDLNSFESLIRRENSARLFLVHSCWENYRSFCIRMAIAANSDDGGDLLRGGWRWMKPALAEGERARGAFNKVPVFGILERKGVARVEVVRDVRAETLLNLTVKTVRRGSIVYTNKFKSYDTLMFCGYRHLKIDHKKKFSSGKVYINGVEGFWSYAKERLIKHHGVSKGKFPLYLKEMEFRYNNRHRPIFGILVQYLTNFVPDRL